MKSTRTGDPRTLSTKKVPTKALYKQLRWRRRFNEADMLHPYQWIQVSSTAVMTREHFKCTCLSAKMVFHLTKDKIRDKYDSFSWENL